MANEKPVGDVVVTRPKRPPTTPEPAGPATVRMVSDAGTKVTVPADLAGLLRGYRRA